MTEIRKKLWKPCYKGLVSAFSEQDTNLRNAFTRDVRLQMTEQSIGHLNEICSIIESQNESSLKLLLWTFQTNFMNGFSNDTVNTLCGVLSEHDYM
jgi:hypothetical protein